MPWLVNNQPVPEAIIRDAEQWVARDPRWQTVRDAAERTKRIQAAAQKAAIDRVLIEQAAARDPRPVDPGAIEPEVARLEAQARARGAFDDTHLRQMVELQFRVHRLRSEMSEGSAEPTQEEIEAFYQQNRENFRKPETFHAAHIVKEVNERQTDEQAQAGIQAALADLERGDPFPEVADRYSDCAGNGGDLGQFRAGFMVDDFEKAIRTLQPGQRTAIFTTEYGYHIAMLYSRTVGEIASLDEVRADIRGAFSTRNREQVFMAGVVKMRFSRGFAR